MWEMRLKSFTHGDPHFDVLYKTIGIRWSALWRLCEIQVQEILPYTTYALMNTSEGNVSATFHDPVFHCWHCRLKRN